MHDTVDLRAASTRRRFSGDAPRVLALAAELGWRGAWIKGGTALRLLHPNGVDALTLHTGKTMRNTVPNLLRTIEKSRPQEEPVSAVPTPKDVAERPALVRSTEALDRAVEEVSADLDEAVAAAPVIPLPTYRDAPYRRAGSNEPSPYLTERRFSTGRKVLLCTVCLEEGRETVIHEAGGIGPHRRGAHPYDVRDEARLDEATKVVAQITEPGDLDLTVALLRRALGAAERARGAHERDERAGDLARQVAEQRERAERAEAEVERLRGFLAPLGSLVKEFSDTEGAST